MIRKKNNPVGWFSITAITLSGCIQLSQSVDQQANLSQSSKTQASHTSAPNTVATTIPVLTVPEIKASPLVSPVPEPTVAAIFTARPLPTPITVTVQPLPVVVAPTALPSVTPSIIASPTAAPVSSSAKWFTIRPDTDAVIYAIHFVDFHTGWVVGANGTIRFTKDAGNTWEIQDKGNQDLLDIHCVDSQTCWIGGTQGVLYKTVDGGKNWDVLDSSITENNWPISGLKFKNAMEGFFTSYIFGSSQLGTYYTQDGGVNWVKKSETGFPNLGLLPGNQVVGISGAVYLYESGAFSRIASLPGSTVGGRYYQEPGFRDANTGWIWCYDCGLSSNSNTYKTDDGGNSWAPMVKINTTDQVVSFRSTSAIAFATPQEGIGIFDGLQYLTQDGGKTWKKSSTTYVGGVLRKLTLYGDIQHGWGVWAGGGKVVRLGVK